MLLVAGSYLSVEHGQVDPKANVPRLVAAMVRFSYTFAVQAAEVVHAPAAVMLPWWFACRRWC